MPYKDPQKKKEYDKAYYLTLTEDQIAKMKAYSHDWWRSPRGKYKSHQRRAVRSKVEFLLSFEEWWDIWQKSGKYSERGPTGYVMCRYGDVGPYAVGNVYIDHASSNKRDAWFNNKIATPTGVYYEDTL